MKLLDLMIQRCPQLKEVASPTPGSFGTKEYYELQAKRQLMKDRTEQLKSVMRTARGPSSTAPLRNNELAQIGQMSTTWNSKNDDENYQTDPGAVQLVDRNDPSPQQNTGHGPQSPDQSASPQPPMTPPQPSGKPNDGASSGGGDRNAQLAKENGFQTVAEFYRALKMNVGSSNPDIAKAARGLLKQVQQNMVISNSQVKPSTTPPPVPTTQTPIRPAPPRTVQSAPPSPVKRSW